VTFTYNGVALGPAATVLPVSGSYQASIQTATLPAGSDTIVATYTGDVNYLGSVGTLTIIIGPQTFALSPSTQSATVSQAGTVTVPLQVSSLSGFGVAFVDLSCSGLPANTSCGFNPNGFVLQPGNQLTAQQTDSTGTKILVPATYGPLNVSLILSTGTTPPVVPPAVGALRLLSGRHGRAISLALLGLSPLTLLLRRRASARLRKSLAALTMMLLLGFSIGSVSGCGSNLIGYTAPGTYQITITAVATIASGSTYGGTPVAPCVYTPTGTTTVTCTQTSQLTLVVKPSGGQ
jgi:hypothetical protein